MKKLLSIFIAASMLASMIPANVLAEENKAAEDKTVDLVLFMGQSNMAGRGDAAEAPEVPEGHGYEFRAVTDPTALYPVSEPFGENENNDAISDYSGSGENRRSGGMVSALMNSYYDAAGVPIVGVQCSQGGKNTKYFKQEEQLNEAVERYNSAVRYLEENDYDIRRRFLVWCQGESDADGVNTESDDTIVSSINGYKLRTVQIFDYLEEYTGITNEFIVQTGHYNYNYALEPGEEPDAERLGKDENYLRIANAQKELADEDAQIDLVATFYTDEAFADMRDYWHYNQPVYNAVGEMAGHNIAAVYDESVEAVPVPGTEDKQAPEETDDPDDSDVLFDFNGAIVPVFEDTGNGSITSELIAKSSDPEDKYMQVNAGKASKTSVAAAYMDLADYTDQAQEIEISFDMHIPYQSRSCIALVDKAVRGDDHGGSIGDGYSSSGAIFTIIGQKNGRLTVGDVNIGPNIVTAAGDDLEWVHYDISIDLLSKTIDYSACSIDGGTVYTSAKDVGFADSECGAFTGIETFSWLPGEQLSIDKLSIKASVPDAAARITGPASVSKTKGSVITKSYSIEKNYIEDSDVFKWSVAGVDGVTIDKDTGMLSADGIEGSGTAVITAEVVSSEKLEPETQLVYNVDILDFAVRKDFELVSDDELINVSEMETYGTDTFRLYKSDGSYESAAAENGLVANASGEMVTVVPEYKFDFTSQKSPSDPLIAGYVKANDDSYKSGMGYGFDGSEKYINENGCSPMDGRSIKIELPDGLYDITLYRLGRDHTDVYANGMQIVQNTSSTAAQNRPSDIGLMYAPGMKIEGGNANITIGNCGDKGRIASVRIARVPDTARKPVIWIAGDSESADYYPIDKNGDDLFSDKIMMTGFGMQLGKVLSDKYDVVNFGQQSATAESWSEECLASVAYHMQKGDTIIIDFGINDGHKGVGRDNAEENIKNIVDMAKRSEAQAILVSPVYNMDYQDRSYFTYDPETGENELKDLAVELGVPFIDLNRYTQEYIRSAKAETGDEHWTENNYHISDTLHLTQHSALLAADIIAAGMKKLGYETTDFKYNYKDISGTALDTDGNIIRGEETGISREYSVAAVENSVIPYDPAKEPDVPPSEEPEKTPNPDVTPGPVLYSEDFEGFGTGNSAGWSSPYGTAAVAEDAEKGKYLQKASDKSGAARSAYIELPVAIDKDFVFEADLKTSGADQISSFEIVEKRSSIYINHGVYSNEQYAFKLARPIGEDLYVVNNKISDSNLTLDKYSKPAVLTKEFGNDPWLHIKVVGDFEAKTTAVRITSLDGSVEYYHGMTNMSDGMNSFKCLSLISPSDDIYTCIDNIVIREAVSNDKLDEYHTVTISDFGVDFNQYVLDGESVVNIPDTSVYGDCFEGWLLNGVLYSSEELAQAPITSDCTITSKISESYIEPIADVGFNEFPDGNILSMGADGETFADNIISLKITGEKGTSMVLSPDDKVNDYSIEWSFDGFRTLDGKSTGETGFSYCDSYGWAEITEQAQTSVNFRLKNTAANYYGKVTAKVTYNGKTITVSRALAVLGDKSAGIMLPRGGYVSDMSKYEDTMIGTRLCDDMAVSFDGWTASSVSDTCYASLEADGNGKFMRFTRTVSGSNAYLYNPIGMLNSQALIGLDVRFNANVDIYYTDGSAGNKEDQNKEAFRLTFDGSTLKLNGEELTKASKDVWYHAEISVSPETKTAECRIFDASGNIIGQGGSAYKGDKLTSQKYLVLKPSKSAGTVDINNVTVTDSAVDSIEITSIDTVSIPESGSEKIELVVSAETKDGYAASDKAVWSTSGDSYGTVIENSSSDTHSAVLTVTDQASSGYVTVTCTIDGMQAVKRIKLIGSKDNIAFENAPAGIMIPISGENTMEYRAVVRNGQAEEIPGKTVKYSLAEEVSGAEIDPNTGMLTVTDKASPGIIKVMAVSSDASGNEISKTVEVRLYNLKFSLGTERDGYTTVLSEDVYSDLVGYGITGQVTDGGDSLEGRGFGFNIRLERGKVYRVTVEHEGELVYEKKDSFMTGIIPSDDKFTDGNSIDIALFGDDILDIALTGDGSISTIEITTLERTRQAKPDWWTIGDSTVSQSGSWASTLAEENDLSAYPELADVIDEFHNSGCAGRHHMSFYNQGWFNYILANMNPGDVVSISGMGTNNSSSTQELFDQFDNFYIDAIIEMGGYVVLGTYTPVGNYGEAEGKVYDADNMIFKGRRTEPYEQAIRDVYEDRKSEANVIGFIDIGRICDDKLTADVQSVYKKAEAQGYSETEARAEADARAEEIMGWWKDYNHYYSTLSQYILPEITAEMAGIISGINEDKWVADISYSNGAVTVDTRYGSVEEAELLHASYDNGVLVSVSSTVLDLSEGTASLKVTAKPGDKFFVWNSAEEMKPLCGTYTVEK